jgi:hypothetical protein
MVEVSLEAIIAILGLLIAMPPMLLALAKCVQWRRQKVVTRHDG